MDYQFSQHALEQMSIREISEKVDDDILSYPGQTVEQDSLIIYQSIVSDTKFQPCLIRVFVNAGKIPPMIVTVYRTSKIEKYYEDKI